MRRLMIVVILFCGLGNNVSTSAQEPSPITPVRPITEGQLRRYLEESLLLTASEKHIQDGLDQTRKTLPPWFPDKVWRDVKHDVAAVDLVKVVLPAYQHHFTETDGDAMILLFEGPTGHEYAEAALQSRLAAVQKGLEGSAAEKDAMNSQAETRVIELRKQRTSELTPEELARLRALGTSGHESVAEGLKVDDEQNALIQKKMNEVIHATLAAHNSELVSAQSAYQSKH